MDLLETVKETLFNKVKYDFCDLCFKDESDLKIHTSDVNCDFFDFVSK